MTPDLPALPSELVSLATSRVRDAPLREPLYVDGGDSIVEVCRRMAAQGRTHALVRDGTRLGIFTTTDLRDAVIGGTAPAQLPVRDAARFALVEVDAGCEVFEALWRMVRHGVHRLIVRDGGQVVGVLGQLDLLAFVAHHSHVVAPQIDAAASVAELADAAQRIDRLIEMLHGSGIHIERIARLVSGLNRRLFARTWALCAPAALRELSCLLVMGSEGRGEQVLRTDQDNALLLHPDAPRDEAAAATARFADALAAYGFPPCPGGIMASQPMWRQDVAGLRRLLAGWFTGLDPDPEGPMRLSIFLDADAVAGDATLLDQARDAVHGLVGGHDVALARLAAAADQFEEPTHWFTRLTTRRDDLPLDLKKLGTFPIVHGVRALALQAGLRQLGTGERIAALIEAGRLDAAQGRDLLDTLHFVMRLRLTHQLRQRDAGVAPGNVVRAAELGALEREPLRDALAIVRRFRGHLRRHFHLDAV